VGLRAFLERTDAEALYVRETFMNGKGPTLSFSQMRCWKRDAYRYKYRAHELPVPTNGKWGKVERTNFVWEHRPPGGRAWKREHMLMLLLMDVEENPGDPRPVYYLGREYMYLQAWRMCLEKMSEYIRIAPLGDTDISEAWGNMATCHKQLGETSAMTMCLWRALAEQPHRRDWYGWLAEYYHERKDHALAAGLLKAALELPRPETGYINEQWHGAYIYDLLARCLWYAGKKSDGLPFAQRAVELSPDDDHLRDNLRWFESEGAA
jgi:tetratricopeptide (TPR) repeat protein